MQTIRRDWLMRQVEAGKIEAKCDIHLTDDYLADVANEFGKTGWMPARMSHPKFGKPTPEYPHDICLDCDFVEGQMNFRKDHFEGNCGRAYWENKESGLISLYVHSNLSYTLQLVKN